MRGRQPRIGFDACSRSGQRIAIVVFDCVEGVVQFSCCNQFRGVGIVSQGVNVLVARALGAVRVDIKVHIHCVRVTERSEFVSDVEIVRRVWLPRLVSEIQSGVIMVLCQSGLLSGLLCRDGFCVTFGASQHQSVSAAVFLFVFRILSDPARTGHTKSESHELVSEESYPDVLIQHCRHSCWGLDHSWCSGNRS